MLPAFYPPCEFDATKVITQADRYTFRTNGRVVLQNGWHDVPDLGHPPKVRKKAKASPDDAKLPPLKPGDTRPVKKT